MEKSELLHMHDRIFNISVCQQAREGEWWAAQEGCVWLWRECRL